MRFLSVLVAALLCGAAWSTALAQNGGKSSPSLMGSNSEGFQFIVAFMQNEDNYCSPPGTDLRILVGSRFDTRFKVHFPDGSVRDTMVRAYSVVQIAADYTHEMIGEGVFRKSIEVVSSERPITVTVYNGKEPTSD